jgi:hypothetical protein
VKWSNDLSSKMSLLVATALTGFVSLPEFPGPLGKNTAYAQSIESTMDERAAELRAFRGRLLSDDYIDRAAAFEMGMASSDPLVRQVTLKEAFLSHNKDLQTLALRHWISSHTTLIVQLTMPDRISEAMIKARDRDFGESILLERLSVSEKGDISGYHSRSGMSFVGQFVPASIILVGSGGHLLNCELNLAVIDDTLLSGAVRCQGLDPILARVQIE